LSRRVFGIEFAAHAFTLTMTARLSY